MTSWSIRDLPEDLMRKIKALAVADHRSASAETITLLEEAVRYRLDDLAPDEARAMGLE